MKYAFRFTLPCLAALVMVAGCGREELTIHSPDDAKNARIGAMTGSTGEALVIKRFPDADLKSFDDVMDAVAAISSGQLDAMVTAFPAALQVTKKNPQLALLEEPLDYEYTAIAVRKADVDLLASLNRIIAELKSDGTLESMKRRWFKPDLSPYEELQIDLPEEGTPLIVGVSATREPFSFVDQNGRVTGHDGELARIIGAKLGRPVVFSDMKFMALIPALQSGKVDLIVTGMTATEERAKVVSFTDTYYDNAQVMLVKKAAEGSSSSASESRGAEEGGTEIYSLAQIDGKRIVVLSGSAGDLAARKHFPNSDFHALAASADAALAVKTRKADAFVYDKSVLVNLVEKNPELVILDEPVAQLEVAAAIKKENAALLSSINRVLDELRAEGVLAQLRAKWIDSKYAETPEMEPADYARGDGILKMGTCATIEPFSFLADGAFAGLDIELAHLIAQRMGMRVEVHDMTFESLIPALQAGKIDFALSNFNVTEERKKLISFSSPYVENDISALVRKASVADTPHPRSDAAQTSGPDRGRRATLVSIDDVKDKRIGVLMGSAHDTYATKNYPNATIYQYRSPADVALAVKSGKVDAALFDAEPLREIMRQDDSYALLGESLFDFDVGSGFRKDRDDVRLAFDRFLSEIQQNGVYDDMIGRWMERGETLMPSIESSGEGGDFMVGVADVGLPFVAVQDNELVGFDVELATRFAARLGKSVLFSNMEFGSLIAAVSSGKVDMIISSIYITEERQKQITFSESYYKMGTRVFALKENVVTGESEKATEVPAAKLASLDDLSDKRIGVLLGSVHDVYAKEHFPTAVILQYKTFPDLVMAVRAAKIDAGLYTRETVVEMVRDDNDLALLGGSVLSYPIGMGFRKGNDTLRNQFNAFLSQIKGDGTYDDIVNRWMIAGSTDMPAMASPGADGVLVVGIVSDKGLPFTVVKDGRPIGFDIELAERFAAYIGKTAEFSDMEFGSLIAAVASGKIDMISSTLMFTEERKERIDFSEPYHELGANFFALKKNVATDDSADEAPPESPSFFAGVVNSFRSNIIQEKRYLLIWDGLRTTVIISIFAAIFGTLLGALVCFMRMSHRKVVNMPARIFINILRGTPVLVLLMLIFYVVFASVNINAVVVAIIAFGLNFAAYVSEIFRTGIEGVDKGQTEAGIAMGFTKVRTFLYIVLPQTVQRILPVYKGEFISLVKMTSIVGYIAVQDLTKASDIIRSRTFDAFFPLIMVAILYFVISWVLMQFLEYLERVTDPKHKRVKLARAVQS